ncbi:uncharacterized protein B0H18DRAFT_567086 [Fomitopsis serialis]|uniref:uncharacterized protein n=1 Tax=Fomitopsis serialis TaxID=139415 RepID=UPI00200749D7|nr:uncharacterized protein B0H18DRAFT_567086 [Neoantrodia serialis]KAH9921337.1 hypothetical protein B0H18DRAFT_567086 [Neoantrodia serialis]
MDGGTTTAITETANTSCSDTQCGVEAKLALTPGRPHNADRRSNESLLPAQDGHPAAHTPPPAPTARPSERSASPKMRRQMTIELPTNEPFEVLYDRKFPSRNTPHPQSRASSPATPSTSSTTTLRLALRHLRPSSSSPTAQKSTSTAVAVQPPTTAGVTQARAVKEVHRSHHPVHATAARTLPLEGAHHLWRAPTSTQRDACPAGPAPTLLGHAFLGVVPVVVDLCATAVPGGRERNVGPARSEAECVCCGGAKKERTGVTAGCRGREWGWPRGACETEREDGIVEVVAAWRVRGPLRHTSERRRRG